MIFDIETDGLELSEVTKIHCMAYKLPNMDHVQVTTDYQKMRDLLQKASELIGHNIILYDVPVLKKILKIDIKAKLIDTLGISWYIYPNRVSHGLESYGEEFGVPKPVIADWKTLPIAEYKHRCIEDVRINSRLWGGMKKKLLSLYGDVKSAKRLIAYLAFKLDCVQEQKQSQWKLNLPLATQTLDELLLEQERVVKELSQHMPIIVVYATKTPPTRPYLKNGGLSASGRGWDSLMKSMGLQPSHREPVRVQVSEAPPNPNSHAQIKDWLFSLGWEPETFKYEKTDQGERRIPQVRKEGEDGKELCPSVIKLFDKYPFLQNLENLTILQHRISILKGFLTTQRDGFLRASMLGFTNTLRLKHREIVNLPGVYKPYGKEVRGSLIAKDGNILCGSDMSSLEDNTKKHYMYAYDPKYVDEMSSPTFDPHLDLAKFAKKVTQDDIDFYVTYKKLSKNPDFTSSSTDQERWRLLDIIRKMYKSANYACIYGVGAGKLARTIDSTVKEAAKLIEVYWQRNWSIRQFSDSAKIITVDGEMWVYNPVSRFYYSLRNKKDVFSTINQSTGVFCFDTWIKHFRKLNPQLTAQFHDEIIKEVPEDYQKECEDQLLLAIEQTNNSLKLNVTLRVDIHFGHSYADIH